MKVCLKNPKPSLLRATFFVSTLTIAIFGFMILSSLELSAKQYVIKGKVIEEETEEALIGATVQISDLRLGAVTDANGQYEFEAPEGEHIVEVSYIGYEKSSKQINLNKDQTLDFYMSRRDIMTNDIVVVGLTGEVDRTTLGNTISTVSDQDIAKVVSSSAIDALNGRIAGVQVTKNSGTPGAGTYITLRGRRTISGSSEPLYVVDGIIIDNTSLYDPGGTKQFANRAVDINPNDIESIEVLKGASAAAIYGSQASNGVVLITTKRGKLSASDKPARVSFSSNYTLDQKYGDYPLQTMYGQVPGSSTSWGDKLAPDTETYDQDDVPFRNGFSHEQSLTVSGGIPQFDYLVNGTYLDQLGYVEGSTYERSSVRANLGATIVPGLTIQSNSNFMFIDNDLPQDGSNTSGILLGALRTPPEFNNEDYLNPDGTQRRFAYYDNPIWTQKYNTYNSKVDRFFHSTQAKWKPFSWVTLTALYGFDNYTYDNFERLAVGSANSPNRQGYIMKQNIQNSKQNFDLNATFQKRFMDDKLYSTLVVGSQIIWDKRSNNWEDAIETLPFYSQVDAGATKDAGTANYEKKIVGIFGQMTTTYMDRISLTLALRRDGSSTFGNAEQFHYYPKAGLSYTLSDEKFMDKTSDILSNLRLRASYGEAGSPDLPGIYATNFLYGTGGFFSPWDRDSKANRGGYIGMRQGGLPASYYVVAGNEDISPERTKEWEAGFDLGFLKNRLNFEFTYYHQDIYDLILDVPTPTSTGYDMQLRNAGEMWNKGIELALRANPVRMKNFSWNTTFIYSTEQNEVTKLDINPEPTGDEFISLNGGFVGINNVAMVGEPLGIFRGYGYLRDDAGNVLYSYYDAESGQVVGDPWGMNTVGVKQWDDALQIIGDPNPDFMLSWRNDFTILNDFNVSFLIDAVIGHDIWNGTYGALNNFGKNKDSEDREELWFNDQGEAVMDYTDPDNPVQVPREYKYRYYENGFYINEPHIQDGSFVKLREITIDYQWDGLRQWDISYVIFSFAARNLLTISEYKGFDPEVNTFSLAEGRGFDYFTLPQMQSFRFGISVIY